MHDLQARLQLDRPLAVFDIEATGTNPRADRIVELAIGKLPPDGALEWHVFRVNPEIPIPAGATAIHGIHDADVAQCPTFREIAGRVLEILDGCDLGGYNLLRYDIPMLVEEFLRAGLTCDLTQRRVFDAQRVFHKREPRDLTAAVAFYCNGTHENAHGAQADVLATINVMAGQLRKYPDLPANMNGLHEYCAVRKEDWADMAGKLKWVDGQIVLNFGKKQGTPLRRMVEQDPKYLKWLLKSDFASDTKQIVQNALEGKYPDPP
ncbi:MAG: 3'-5' exonuclease [Kiritimatiellae bacterium]|nr:3'-5' exonuclease [Kiritimatiellia bacterium]